MAHHACCGGGGGGGAAPPKTRPLWLSVPERLRNGQQLPFGSGLLPSDHTYATQLGSDLQAAQQLAAQGTVLEQPQLARAREGGLIEAAVAMDHHSPGLAEPG
jgi:hypothetical protein